MPLPPAPTQRASTLQAQIKVSTEKTFKLVEKKATSDKEPDPFSVNRVKNKSLTDESATDFSVNNHQALKLNPLSESSVSQPKSKKKKKSSTSGPAKLFVLDTNVLMHDPMCLFRFEEHDIFLPMIVLEELDSNKKGMTEVARNARQTSRTLDALVGLKDSDISQGIPLNGTGHSDVGGKLFFQTKPLEYSLPTSLPQGKADNQILGVVQALGELYQQRQVVLVSKDINMRVKARALGLPAEDYQNDKTLEDGDLLYSGSLALPIDFWSKQAKTVESWQASGNTFYRIGGPIVSNMHINQFIYFRRLANQVCMPE